MKVSDYTFETALDYIFPVGDSDRAKKSTDALMGATLDGNQKLYQKAQEFFGLGAFQKV